MQLGWIGTGIMGRSMCGHLMSAGHSLTIYSRTRAKAEELLKRGAAWAATPQAVAAASEIVFTMVGFPQDVREVGDQPPFRVRHRDGDCDDLDGRLEALSRGWRLLPGRQDEPRGERPEEVAARDH